MKLLPKEEIDAFVPANIAAGTLDGKLVMLPRAQFDVSALYYQKSLYQDEAKKKAYKDKYGEELGERLIQQVLVKPTQVTPNPRQQHRIGEGIAGSAIRLKIA